MPLSYPRVVVELDLLVGGEQREVTIDGVTTLEAVGAEEVTTPIIPDEVTWTVQPHSRCATAEITVQSSAVPFDLDRINSMLVRVYAGNATRGDGDILADRNFRQQKNLRFIGDVDEPEKILGIPSRVTLKARDLSARLRDAPLPASGMPRYQDTVDEALQRILDIVPGVADQLSLGQSVVGSTLAQLSGRKARKGPLDLRPGTRAWDAIEAVCGLAGLLVHVELDQVIVREPGEAFGDPGQVDDVPPDFQFIWNDERANTAELRFKKKFIRNRKGLRAWGFDPELDQVIQAVWPPDGQLLLQKKPRPSHPGANPGGKAGRHRGTRASVVERESIFAPGIQTTDGLLRFVQGVWAERGSQEVEGQLQTPIWTDELLALKNGARVLVMADPATEAQLRQIRDRQQAIDFLQRRMRISEETAKALVSTAKRGRFDMYLLGTASHSFTKDSAPASTIHFINLIRS